MKTLQKMVIRFMNDEQGATAIEYGLLVALIALVMVAGATLIGTGLSTLFTNIAACISAPTVAANCTF